MSKNSYEENRIAEAKEKLACHIADPRDAKSSGAHDDGDSAAQKNRDAQNDFIDETGKVLLTRMTAAGG